MSFPPDYPAAAAGALWGGVCTDTSGPDFTSACQQAQSALRAARTGAASWAA